MAAAIRTLCAQDVVAAQDVVRSFHSAALSDDYLQSILLNSANLLLVAQVADRVVGFLYGHWIDRLYSASAQLFIYEVEVAEGNRRSGIASALMSAALAHAQRRDARTFVFTNHSNRAAVALYEKAGGIARNGDDLLFIFAPTRHGAGA